MTTVAYKNGLMACDSCYSYDGCVDTLQSKIQRLKSGALLGSAGANDARDIIALLQNVKTPANLPTTTELLSIRQEFLGLLVLPSGRMFKIATTFVSPENWDADFNTEDFGCWEIKHPFAAVGSGGPLANVAMDCGLNAEKAVLKACRWDMATRGPVHVLELKPAMKKRKRK